jgi:hypothetical protein
LMAVAISVVIALARKRGLAWKRGMFQHPASKNEMPEWMCGMVIVEQKHAAHAVHIVTTVGVSRH